jgi:hypothetical protein
MKRKVHCIYATCYKCRGKTEMIFCFTDTAFALRYFLRRKPLCWKCQYEQTQIFERLGKGKHIDILHDD